MFSVRDSIYNIYIYLFKLNGLGWAVERVLLWS